MKRKLAIIITTVAIVITFLKSNQFKDDNLDFQSLSESNIANEVKNQNTNNNKEHEENPDAEEDSLPKEFEDEELKLSDKEKSKSLKDTYLGYIQVEGEMSDSSIVFNESINMIENDPSFLVDDDAANSLSSIFNSIFWDELNLDPNAKQPITLVEGNVHREFDNTLGGPYNVYKTVMTPTIGDSTNVFITIYYCGNTANYNSQGAIGKGILKVWALPVGVYYRTEDNGRNYTNYVYVSGDSIQHAAYNLFGEWWNN